MILILFGVTANVYAQQQGISGTVIDASTSETLPGVNILVKGTTAGTSTDGEGNYELEVPSLQDTLVVSFVGYQTREVPINGRTEITVQLQPQAIAGEEVVVVGYGTQEAENLTGSISTKNADFIKDRPLTNASQAIQGIGGVYVNQEGGQPGADNATIRIRGISTFGNNNPLVLVDGVEGSLRDVNPIDIENISVLKDAAAASIYGNRAASGVILITTKSGTKGGDLQADYTGYFGMQESTFLPDAVSNAVTYMEARNQASLNEGQDPPYSQEAIEEYRNGTDPDIYPNTDWMDVMFNPAPMQEHNLRLHGGSEQATYSFTLGYLNQDGVLMGTDAEKYSLNTNLKYDITDKLSVGAKISGTYWDRREGIGGTSWVMNLTFRALPIHPNKLSDGRYGDTWLTTPGHNVFRDPVALATEGKNDIESLRLLGHIDVNYVLPFGFEYNLNIAANKYDFLQSRFQPNLNYWNPKTNESREIRFSDVRHAYRNDQNNLNTTFFQTLNWTGDIGDHSNVETLIGFSRETFMNRGFNARREGFFGNTLYDLNAGSLNDRARGSSSESALMSYFGRVNYTLLERYLLEFNFRYDGSSRFAEGNRWGFFPSVSGAWRVSEEPFMSNVEVLNEFKLRASWGTLGNQDIPLFSYVSTVQLNQGHSFNDNLVPGAAITSIADPDITWETTTIKNFGVDLHLLNNRLGLTADVFDKKTTDILTQINVPAQVGNLGGPTTNLYSMSNKGLEVEANFRNSVSNDFSYHITGGAAYVTNNVDFLDGDVQYGGNTRWGSMYIITEGHPVR